MKMSHVVNILVHHQAISAVLDRRIHYPNVVAEEGGHNILSGPACIHP